MQNHKFVYYPVFEKNCLRACMYNYLLQNGYENPLYYVDASIKIIDYSNINENTEVSNTGLYSKNLDNLYINFGDITQVWEKDKIILDQGCALIFDVDVYYLPYRKEYQKVHGSHGIICEWYKGDRIGVVDWIDPYYFIGEIHEKDMLISRSSDNPYSDNPFSGMSMNSFSIGIINEMRTMNREKSVQEWVLDTSIDYSFIDKIRSSILKKTNIKEICDYWHLIQRDISFAMFFVERMIINNVNIMNKLSQIKNLVSKITIVLIKFGYKPNDEYIVRCSEYIDEIKRELMSFNEMILSL